MKKLKSEEAITILEDMKVNISILKAEVTQIKRNAALNMAIDALLKCSEIPNDSDTISRQAAIDALFELYEYQRDIDPTEAADLVRQGIYLAEKKIEQLPSVQPEKRTEKRTETHACDCISREAAIDALHMHLMYRMGTDSNKKRLDDWINGVPSAQSERKTGHWIYGEDDVAMCDGYHCSECGFFVPWDYKRKSIDFIKDYNFCPNCGSPMVKEGEA